MSQLSPFVGFEGFPKCVYIHCTNLFRKRHIALLTVTLLIILDTILEVGNEEARAGLQGGLCRKDYKVGILSCIG